MEHSNWVIEESLIKELFAKVWAQCEKTPGICPGLRTVWGEHCHLISGRGGEEGRKQY